MRCRSGKSCNLLIGLTTPSNSEPNPNPHLIPTLSTMERWVPLVLSIRGRNDPYHLSVKSIHRSPDPSRFNCSYFIRPQDFVVDSFVWNGDESDAGEVPEEFVGEDDWTAVLGDNEVLADQEEGEVELLGGMTSQ